MYIWIYMFYLVWESSPCLYTVSRSSAANASIPDSLLVSLQYCTVRTAVQGLHLYDSRNVYGGITNINYH